MPMLFGGFNNNTKNTENTKSIVVLGGMCAGKTCLTTMLTEYMKSRNVSVKYVSGMNHTGRDQNRALSAYDIISHTPATALSCPNIIQLHDTKSDEKTYTVSIIDIATEELLCEGNNVISAVTKYGNNYLGNSSSCSFRVDGVLLVINPLLFYQNANENDSLLYGKAQHSRETQNRIISTLGSSEINNKIAIVFTRCDVPIINEKIGEIAINEYMWAAHIDRDTATENLIKSYLLYYKQYEFLNCIESKYKCRRFFVSGIFDDYLERGNTIDPLLWLIE